MVWVGEHGGICMVDGAWAIYVFNTHLMFTVKSVIHNAIHGYMFIDGTLMQSCAAPLFYCSLLRKNSLQRPGIIKEYHTPHDTLI
jgi:hypothetical protein